MVYFSKKQAASGSATISGNNTFTGTNTFNGTIMVPNPTQNNQAANKSYVDTNINGCAKLGAANTFTQQNTFNQQTNFREKVELKNNSSNNGAYLSNFDYYNNNYTALKFFTGGSNTLQIEVNHTANHATISAPTTSNNLEILNLKNPTNANDAANKQYVDSRTTTYKWEGTVANNVTQNLETIGWDKHIIGVNVFRKRNDSQWFCINNNMTQQLYRDNGTGQFKLYGSNANGSPAFTDEYRVYITYIN